jgi:hypothetical protein
MEDVWANLRRDAKVAVLPQLIDIDEAKDWEIWHARHDAEVEAQATAQTQTADANKKPGFFARLFGRK